MAAHRSWTKADHVPRFIQSLAQDRDGFLWVGSAEGLFRFDGTEFEKVEPAPGHRRTAIPVSALAASPDGSVWVGYAGRGGVSRLINGVLHDTGMPDPPAEVTFIVIADGGEPYIAAGDGNHPVLSYKAGRWLPMVEADQLSEWSIEPVLSSRRGTLWFTTWYHGVFFKRATSERLERTPTPFVRNATLQEDSAGSIWQLDASGLRRLPGYDRGEVGKPSRPVGLMPPSHRLRSATDLTGRIWATTVSSGVFTVRPADGRVARFTAADGLTSDRVSAITADRDGNVWVGSEAGLDRFSATPIQSVSMIPDGASTGYLAAESRGSVYLASDMRIWRSVSGRPLQQIAKMDTVVKALCAGTGDGAWAHVGDRLISVDGQERGTELPLPTSDIVGIGCAFGPDGSPWLAMNDKGLFHRVDGAWRKIPLPPQLGPVNNITFDREGRPLAITGRQNVIRVDGSRLTVWRGDRISFERPTAFSSNTADVLVGGYTGLLRIGENGIAKLDFSDHPWLRDIRAIANAANGQTWLIGYAGITRVATTALMNAFDHPRSFLPHTTFDQDDRRIALPQSGAGLQAVTDASGHAWFLTRAGVLSAMSEAEPATVRPFKVFIRAIDVDGRRYRDPHKLSLPNDTAAITITYGAIDLTTAMQRRYRTRLVGNDASWSDNADRREVTYMRLAPGHYRFEVQTNDALGGWQAAGAGLEFTIAPAFYQTKWFLAFASLLAGVMLFALYRWRARAIAEHALLRAEARVAERERIARDLHNTLLQSVQGLFLRIRAVVNRMSSDDPNRTLLSNTLTRANDLLIEGRNRVLELRKPIQRSSLNVAMRELIGTVEFGPEVATSVRLRGVSRPIREDVTSELLAIIREALTNAARHARASEVLVEITFTRLLRITVLDDGIGFDQAVDAAQGRQAFGLVGMRERAASIKARLRVGPGPAGGTLVELRIPGRRAYADLENMSSRSPFWRRSSIS